MVAPRKSQRIVCTVIRVPAYDAVDLLEIDRPSNRLPWTDPTIARLVANLQDEVRSERREAKMAWRAAMQEVADLEPPSPASDGDWEWHDEPRWTWPQ